MCAQNIHLVLFSKNFRKLLKLKSLRKIIDCMPLCYNSCPDYPWYNHKCEVIYKLCVHQKEKEQQNLSLLNQQHNSHIKCTLFVVRSSKQMSETKHVTSSLAASRLCNFYFFFLLGTQDVLMILFILEGEVNLRSNFLQLDWSIHCFIWLNLSWHTASFCCFTHCFVWLNLSWHLTVSHFPEKSLSKLMV